VDRLFLDRRGARDEIRRFAAWLEGEDAAGALAPPFNPPTDVVETADAVEIVVDLPGIPLNGIRVVWSKGTLVVAGRKPPLLCEHRETTFHLAERRFGRFVAAIRLSGAVDAGRASAVLQAGELRILVPRVEERRGREIEIAVKQG
jgi:HSP20 family protein